MSGLALTDEGLSGGHCELHLPRASLLCVHGLTVQNVAAKLNFNYLDRLIAGEESKLQSSLRYWRTRYILIPSGRDPLTLQGVVPKGESFDPTEILLTGAYKVLEILGRNQWHHHGQEARPLRLLPTTFDPSACILDEGLMTELERLTTGTENIDRGKTLEGMTLPKVADMMRQPNNGLIIRDRWWNCEPALRYNTDSRFGSRRLLHWRDVLRLARGNFHGCRISRRRS